MFPNTGKSEYFTLYPSAGEAFWSLAIEIPDYVCLTQCFLNSFDHRIFFGGGRWQGTPIHFWLDVLFLWNSVVDMLPQLLVLSLKYGPQDPAQRQMSWSL